MHTPDSPVQWSFAGEGELADCPEDADDLQVTHWEEEDGEHLIVEWDRGEWFWAEPDSFISLEETR